MKIAPDNREEEYREFLKKIREEREGTSNFAKLLFTIVLAVLCAVIVCVTVVENNYIFSKYAPKQMSDSGIFQFTPPIACAEFIFCIPLLSGR